MWNCDKTIWNKTKQMTCPRRGRGGNELNQIMPTFDGHSRTMLHVVPMVQSCGRQRFVVRWEEMAMSEGDASQRPFAAHLRPGGHQQDLAGRFVQALRVQWNNERFVQLDRWVAASSDRFGPAAGRQVAALEQQNFHQNCLMIRPNEIVNGGQCTNLLHLNEKYRKYSLV